MKKRLRATSLVLVLLFIFAPMAAIAAEEGAGWISVPFTEIEDEPVRFPEESGITAFEEDEAPLSDEEVRVSIVLDEESTMDAGFEAEEIGGDEALRYRAALSEKQEDLAEEISEEVLDGEDLDVVWNLTLAANLISANVPGNRLEDIRALDGVKEVVLEECCEPCEVQEEEASPNMAIAVQMTDADDVWESGYTGAGCRIAIIDTGLDPDHQSFAESAYRYALEQTAEEMGISYEEYTASLHLLTDAEVKEKWDQLNFSERYGETADTFISEKVPYGANYVDVDLDILHNDANAHGSHVAGISAANRFIPKADGTFSPALQAVNTQGVAPDAQLIVMRVFGKTGGAWASDYMAAIEDAIVLGADSVNLSLGSSNAGPSRNSTYQTILDNLSKSNTVVTTSAGNEGAWADQVPGGKLYGDGVNYAMHGSPGSYTNAFSVAAVANDGQSGYPIKLSGFTLPYAEKLYKNPSVRTLAGEQPYVFYDNVGVDAQGNSLFTADAKGKIAVCRRGISPFANKVQAAADAGAIGIFILNTDEELLNLDLSECQAAIPCVAMKASAAARFRSAATSTGEGGSLLGTLTVGSAQELIFSDSPAYEIRTFSSFGGPTSLELKPEIASPGGKIYSVDGSKADGKSYVTLSGTSMAAPHVAGMTALVMQYLREKGLSESTGLSPRYLAQSLLMSTAEPMVEKASGSYYSLLCQGSGFGNVRDAIRAESYISLPREANSGASDGKIKFELGDDPERSGKYTMTFLINNLTDTYKTFDLSADFFTQARSTSGGVDYREKTTVPLQSVTDFSVNGAPVVPENAEALTGYDFNGDGVVNTHDVQALLDYAVGNLDSVADKGNADLDQSGSVTSHDALLLLDALGASSIVLAPYEYATVTAEVTLTDIADHDDRGAYVEGFVFARERADEEGLCGDCHSIPVLGYYGGWGESPMFDLGSRLDYQYGTETRDPYLYGALGEDAKNSNSFLVTYPGSTEKYYLGGNPVIPDTAYHKERDAMSASSGSTIAAVTFNSIRNASASRATVSRENGSALFSQSLGAVNSAYYNSSKASWVNTQNTVDIGYSLRGLSDGTRLTAAYTLAPEYYVEKDGTVRWDEIGDGCTLSASFVIDSAKPTLNSSALKGKNLTLTVQDNQYIAAVRLCNSYGTMLTESGSDETVSATGAVSTYTFSTSGLTTRIQVKVYDYANNCASYTVDLRTLKSSVSSVGEDAAVLTAGILPSFGGESASLPQSAPDTEKAGGTGYLFQLTVTPLNSRGESEKNRNGTLTLRYDPEEVEIVTFHSDADFSARKENTFAYASIAEFGEEDGVATLILRILKDRNKGIYITTGELGAEASGYTEIVTFPNDEVIYLPGDADGDMQVSIADVTLLAKYLAGWDVLLFSDAASVDGERRLTVADLTVLAKYLAGWDVALY